MSKGCHGNLDLDPRGSCDCGRIVRGCATFLSEQYEVDRLRHDTSRGVADGSRSSGVHTAVGPEHPHLLAHRASQLVVAVHHRRVHGSVDLGYLPGRGSEVHCRQASRVGCGYCYPQQSAPQGLLVPQVVS